MTGRYLSRRNGIKAGIEYELKETDGSPYANSRLLIGDLHRLRQGIVLHFGEDLLPPDSPRRRAQHAANPWMTHESDKGREALEALMGSGHLRLYTGHLQRGAEPNGAKSDLTIGLSLPSDAMTSRVVNAWTRDPAQTMTIYGWNEEVYGTLVAMYALSRGTGRRHVSWHALLEPDKNDLDMVHRALLDEDVDATADDIERHAPAIRGAMMQIHIPKVLERHLAAANGTRKLYTFIPWRRTHRSENVRDCVGSIDALILAGHNPLVDMVARLETDPDIVGLWTKDDSLRRLQRVVGR